MLLSLVEVQNLLEMNEMFNLWGINCDLYHHEDETQ